MYYAIDMLGRSNAIWLNRMRLKFKLRPRSQRRCSLSVNKICHARSAFFHAEKKIFTAAWKSGACVTVPSLVFR